MSHEIGSSSQVNSMWDQRIAMKYSKMKTPVFHRVSTRSKLQLRIAEY